MAKFIPEFPVGNGRFENLNTTPLVANMPPAQKRIISVQEQIRIALDAREAEKNINDDDEDDFEMEDDPYEFETEWEEEEVQLQEKPQKETDRSFVENATQDASPTNEPPTEARMDAGVRREQ